MHSPSQSPNLSLFLLATAAAVMANVDAKGGINFAGYRTAEFQILPFTTTPTGHDPTLWTPTLSATQVDVRIWVWNSAIKKWIDTGVVKSATGSTGLHFTFAANGRILYPQITSSFPGSESAAIFVSAFDPIHDA